MRDEAVEWLGKRWACTMCRYGATALSDQAMYAPLLQVCVAHANALRDSGGGRLCYFPGVVPAPPVCLLRECKPPLSLCHRLALHCTWCRRCLKRRAWAVLNYLYCLILSALSMQVNLIYGGLAILNFLSCLV